MNVIQQGKRGFYLDKGISVEAILAFITLAVAAIGYAMYQDSRSTRLESTVNLLTESDRKAEKDRQELKNDIINRLDRIEARLYEQNGKH